MLAGGQSVGGLSRMGHDGLAGIWVRQVGFDNVFGLSEVVEIGHGGCGSVQDRSVVSD